MAFLLSARADEVTANVQDRRRSGDLAEREMKRQPTQRIGGGWKIQVNVALPPLWLPGAVPALVPLSFALLAALVLCRWIVRGRPVPARR